LTAPAHLVSCGDRSLLVYLGEGIDADLNLRVHTVTRILKGRQHPALVEVTPSYHCLMVEYDPVRIRPDQLEELVLGAVHEAHSSGPGPHRTVEIPVQYGGDAGPDLENVAAHTGLSPDEVIRRHCAGLYRVFGLGFSPGFPYLGGLETALHTPRLAQPRTKVPAGSVAIGGGQTGVYPAESPGGWQLIGRTPVRLFDPFRESPALLEPGDDIRFVPLDAASFDEVDRPALQPSFIESGYGTTGLRILQPGMATTVQDLGRRGFQAYGVSPAGAADFMALMVGNWLLGNRARTAALEITLLGPEVEFTGPVAFCLTGAPIQAELIPAGGESPRPVPGWAALLAGPGDRLRTGAVTAGCRSYLCVAGGIDLPPVLGSLSEDMFGKLGPLGRRLKAGDWLPAGLPLQPPADLAGRQVPSDAIPTYGGPAVVRATLGPQAAAFSPETMAAFFGTAWRIGAQSDRQGIRLDGPPLSHVTKADILSEPIPAGSVQVPAGGQPILLLGNRQTVGGYTKIAVAVYPDLSPASQLRPGDRLQFRQVDAAEAHSVAWAERRKLAQIRRYLERDMDRSSAEAQGHIARVATTPVPPPVPGPAAEPPATPSAGRRFRISILDVEFELTVEEVEE